MSQLFSLGRLFGQLGFGKKSKKGCGSGCCKSGRRRTLQLEPLERRELLSVCTWTGGGANPNWSTAANWDQTPTSGDSLVFDGDQQTQTIDDISNFTAGWITFAAPGFSISGYDLNLVDSAHITMYEGAGDATITADLHVRNYLHICLYGGSSLTLSGNISDSTSGAGGIEVEGDATGTTILAGANTYSQDTQLMWGTLQMGATDAIPHGVGKGNFWNSAGTFDLNGFDTTVNGYYNFGTTTSTDATPVELTVGDNNRPGISNHPITDGSGQLSLTKIGSGSLSISGVNTYTGTTTVGGGTVSLGSAGALGGTGDITFTGGTLKFTASNMTDYASRIKNSTSAIALDTNGRSVTFSTINNSNTAGLTKLGTGTLTLNAANTYTGDTTVNGGTLALGASNVIPDGTGKGSLAINNGATLDMTGHSETINGLSGVGIVNGGTGVLTVGSNDATSAFGGTIQNTAGTLALSKTGAGTLTLSGNNSYTGGTTVSGGTLSAGSSSTVLGTGAVTVNPGGVFDLHGYSPVISSLTGSGSITSTVTGLSTLAVGVSCNDNFANRISLGNASALTTTGSNAGAGKESGEPNHAGNSGGKSVWWTWTPTASGTAQIDTIGSNFDTILGIYTGDSVSGLTPVAGASDNDSGGNLTSKVTFNAVEGTTYRIAVDGYNGAWGSIALQVNMATAQANDSFAARINLGSASTVTTTGSNAEASNEDYEPDHAGYGYGAMKSVWWTWTAPASGSVQIDTIGSDFDTILAVYTGDSVSGLTLVLGASDDDSGGNRTSKVTFNAIEGMAYQIAVDGFKDDDDNVASGNITLHVNETNTSGSTFSGIVSDGAGVVGLAKIGTGGLTLSGANTYTGGTTVYDGTLVVGNSDALQNSTLDMEGAGNLGFSSTVTTATLGGLAGSRDINLQNIASSPLTLTVGGNGSDTVFAGMLSGIGGSLVKNGAGRLTLTKGGTNQNAYYYTGSTTVSEGTLELNGNHACVSLTGDVTISSNAVLRVSGTEVAIAGQMYDPYPYVTPSHGGDISINGELYVCGGDVRLCGDTTTIGSSGTLRVAFPTDDFVDTENGRGHISALQLWTRLTNSGHISLVGNGNIYGDAVSGEPEHYYDMYFEPYATASVSRVTNDATKTKLNVSWNCSEIGTYAIEQSTDGINWTAANTTFLEANSYQINNLTPGVKYQVRVTSPSTQWSSNSGAITTVDPTGLYRVSSIVDLLGNSSSSIAAGSSAVYASSATSAVTSLLSGITGSPTLDPLTGGISVYRAIDGTYSYSYSNVWGQSAPTRFTIYTYFLPDETACSSSCGCSSSQSSALGVSSATGASMVAANAIDSTGGCAACGTATGGLTYDSRNATIDTGFGSGWNDADEIPTLLDGTTATDGVVVVRFGAEQAVWFDNVSGTFAARNGEKQTLVHAGGYYTLTQTDGTQYKFYDADGAKNNPGTFYAKGCLYQQVAPSGETVAVTWNASEKVVTHKVTSQASDNGYERVTYNYGTGLPTSGHVQSSKLQQSTDNGANWTNVRQTSYAYYATGDSYGLPGDLKTITTQQWVGGSWSGDDTYYYRYYTTLGMEHMLERVLLPEAYAKFLAAGGSQSGGDLQTDQIASFTCFYYEYDLDGRVTKEVVFGKTNEYNFATTMNSDPNQYTTEWSDTTNTNRYNTWHRKTVETVLNNSNGLTKSTTTTYYNYVGQVLLTDIFDAVANTHTTTYNRYGESGGGVDGNDGQLILTAAPSAVSVYAKDANGNWDQSAATPVTLIAGGLVYETVYYDDDTGADESTPGNAKGYVAFQLVRKSAAGSVAQCFSSVGSVMAGNLTTYNASVTAQYQYNKHTVGGQFVYPVATTTSYPTEKSLDGGITTNYAYSWYADDPLTTDRNEAFQIKEERTTLASVSAGHNGSGVASATFSYYNDKGQLIWATDENDRFTHYEYDPTTGRMTEVLADADSGDGYSFDSAGFYFVTGTGATGELWPTSLPGSGVSEQTDYQYDALGRVTRILGPTHIADIGGTPTSIRTATWTVYYDASYADSDAKNNALRHQSRTAQGYVLASDESAATIVGPISITKTDLDGRVTDQIQVNYTGTLAAFLAASPTSFSRSTYTSWTASIYRNTRLWATAVYSVIPNDATGAGDLDFIGTFGTNFTLTAFGYENYSTNQKGRLNKTVAVTSYTGSGSTAVFYGTITRYVLDARGNVKETWIGTNDTGAKDDDPDYGGSPNNMVRVSSSTFTADSQTASTTRYVGGGAADRTVSYGYDFRDRLVLAVNPPNAQNTITYSWTRYDNLGEAYETQQYQYSGTSATLAAELATASAAGGAKLRTADVLLDQSTTSYDALGRVYQSSTYLVNASGIAGSPQTTNYWYDANGNQVALEDPNGYVTTWAYNGLGEETQSSLGQIKSAGSTSTTFSNLTKTGSARTFELYVQLATAPSGSWRTAYTATDANGALTITAASGTATPLQGGWYDLGTVTLASGDNSTSFTLSYSGASPLPSEISVVGYGDKNYYNGAGQLTETVDRNGRAITYAYDSIGRPKSELWYASAASDGTPVGSATETISYTYNAAGWLQSVSDENMATTVTATNSYVYDAAGRVTSETAQIPGLTPAVTLADQYTNGDRTQLSATIGTTSDFVNNYSYQYSSQNIFSQMCQVTQTGTAAAKTATFQYDYLGEFAGVGRYQDSSATLANRVAQAAYGYDNLGRLTSLGYVDRNSTTLVGYTWQFDAVGNMSQTTNTIDGTKSFTSDSTGQLLTDGLSGASYSYDANGNRTNTGYVTGLNNELLSDGTFNYTYDAEGNCTLRQRISGAAADDYQTIYQWDNRNRLVSVTFKNNSLDVTKTVNYVYDANNRWLGETIANGSGTVIENRRFAYDGQQIVLQFDSTSSSNLTAGNLSHRYLWGPAVDQLMADEQVSGSHTLWALTDHQNTVRDLATFTSGTTSIVNHRVFSAYGELLSQTNAAAADSLFGYTGRAMSRFSTNPTTGAVTGIQNNNARWYDAIVGRWLGPDPIGYSAGDMNLYRYCGDSPIAFTDASGLATDFNYFCPPDWTPGHPYGPGPTPPRPKCTQQDINKDQKGYAECAKAINGSYDTSYSQIWEVYRIAAKVKQDCIDACESKGVIRAGLCGAKCGLLYGLGLQRAYLLALGQTATLKAWWGRAMGGCDARYPCHDKKPGDKA